MAYVFAPGPSAYGSGRRLSIRRKGVDWRVVALTAACAVMLILMLGRPA